MGGLWVHYNLQSSIPGLHILGEANFSDHGANRLGASALMQGLADGYFVIPYTLGNFIANHKLKPVSIDDDEFKHSKEYCTNKLNKFLNIKGEHSVDSFHKRLGHIMWENVGMSRNKAGLTSAISEISNLRDEFWQNLRVPGENNFKNTELEKAGRVADFLELGELMAKDALNREESCGGHFRDEHQTGENEAQRNDKDFCYVSAWEISGEDKISWTENKEKLDFEYVKLANRSYK